jgi:hypothetical protein
MRETWGMDTLLNAPRPGDLILNRYIPNAAEAEREEARENLKRLARVLMRIEARLAREWHERQTRETGGDEVDLRGYISPPL